MKGRLYFTTKSQKEGRIMIKTHPCAQIFCCDLCGFEQVNVPHMASIVVRMDIILYVQIVYRMAGTAPPHVGHWRPPYTNRQSWTDTVIHISRVLCHCLFRWMQSSITVNWRRNWQMSLMQRRTVSLWRGWALPLLPSEMREWLQCKSHG